MTIIRNDRMSRQEPETSSDAFDEEEIDYRWHPTEEEFVSPLTAEQWAELLGDSSFADTDAFKAVTCLKDYGGPATFQQLSIRYRGTMGRYRRWLGEAAQEAGRRFGIPAPTQNQYGMDEWWPLLYLTRATGKPGAGVFEMVLRDEVLKGFDIIAEKEKMAKRAENARQLQRIEQLERARAEERERRAAEMAKSTARKKPKRTQPQAAMPQETPSQPALLPEQEQASKQDQTQVTPAPQQEALPVEEPTPQPTAAQSTAPEPAPSKADPQEPAQEPVAQTPAKESPSAKRPAQDFKALRVFLEQMEAQRKERASKEATAKPSAATFDVTGAVDYALRYAERLRKVFSLMQEGNPGFTAASAARELGDESVQQLQSMLNGQEIPTFAYLDKLRERLFINIAYLEVVDGYESSVSPFLSLQELIGSGGEVASLFENKPQEIVYLVDDSDMQHTGVAFVYSPLRCALLTREVVEGSVQKTTSKQGLNAYSRMASELDAYARKTGIGRRSVTITAQQWDELVSGSVWPGFVQV